jgi:hypothetical protein
LNPFAIACRRANSGRTHNLQADPMDRDKLIILKPDFLDPAYPGTRFPRAATRMGRLWRRASEEVVDERRSYTGACLDRRWN